MVCGHTTLFLSTHFLFQHYLIASPTPSWMGTLWWPCSKGKSPSREPSSSTAARTQKWSASIALTASRRSSFCRYWQEAFPSLFSLSVLRLCLYHNAFFFFYAGLVCWKPLQPWCPLLLQHTHRGTQGAVCVGSLRLLAWVQPHLSG